MNLRQKKTALTLGSALLGLACLAVLAGAVTLPVRVEADRPRDLPELAANDVKDGNDAPDDPNRMAAVHRDLQRLARLDLRKPLVRPAKPKPERKSRPAPTLRLRLLGTAQEPGHSLAYFQKVDGTTAWLGEGDRVQTSAGEVVVQTITSQAVTIALGERTVELKVPVRSWQKEGP